MESLEVTRRVPAPEGPGTPGVWPAAAWSIQRCICLLTAVLDNPVAQLGGFLAHLAEAAPDLARAVAECIASMIRNAPDAGHVRALNTWSAETRVTELDVERNRNAIRAVLGRALSLQLRQDVGRPAEVADIKHAWVPASYVPG